MPRKTSELKQIEHETNRYVTFCKRKRGLLKKAIELSKLCDQHIYIAIFDENKQRLVEMQSSDLFTAPKVYQLTKPKFQSKINHERYTNDDYETFRKEPSINTSEFSTSKRIKKENSVDMSEKSSDTVWNNNTKKRDKKKSLKSINTAVSDDSIKEQESCSLVRLSEIDCSGTKDEPSEDLGSLIKDIGRTGRGPAMKYRIITKQEPMLIN